MVKVALNGAGGRMGMRILHLACQSDDFKVTAAFEHRESGLLGRDAGTVSGFAEPLKIKISELSPEALKDSQVLIDFSSVEGARQSIHAALEKKIAIVIGTTGMSPEGVGEIRDASKKIPILFSPNMSVGANFLFEAVRLAAAQLKTGYDIEIIEAHHRQKKDAPSGTAKHVAEIIASQKGWKLDKVARYGREGLTGERPKDEIGIHVIRAGDIVGEHTVLFSGPGETLELSHTAFSRDAFARGALSAALFLSKKPAGLYTMADVLKS